MIDFYTALKSHIRQIHRERITLPDGDTASVVRALGKTFVMTFRYFLATEHRARKPKFTMPAGIGEVLPVEGHRFDHWLPAADLRRLIAPPGIPLARMLFAVAKFRHGPDHGALLYFTRLEKRPSTIFWKTRFGKQRKLLRISGGQQNAGRPMGAKQSRPPRLNTFLSA
ncbi:MAG: hypothetical protein NTV49_02175 [Kiritimatiellaeota bacterium]|nr:hypothetical protein [Kiritimatiellota bacterium]